MKKAKAGREKLADRQGEVEEDRVSESRQTGTGRRR